jgi:hypothetical protein
MLKNRARPGIFSRFDPSLNLDEPPLNTIAPVISGTLRVGETLSCTTGTWEGTLPLSYTYQWKRDGSNISLATNSTYILTLSDIGTAITCNVTATNEVTSVSQISNTLNISESISSIISSAVFDLDATRTTSYSGTGQTWNNLIATPADSSSQSTYNFYFGADANASTDDPTFTGSAGSPSAYMAFDGGDRFKLASAMTTFLNNLHKTTGGQDFWIAMALKFIQNDVAQHWFSTGNSTSNSHGIWLLVSSAERVALAQGGGGTSVTLQHPTTAVNNTDYLVIASYSTSLGQGRIWMNNPTKTQATLTFNTSTSAPTGYASIGRNNAGTGPVPSGTRVYAVSMGNSYIDDVDASKLFSLYEARHQRDYTP